MALMSATTLVACAPRAAPTPSRAGRLRVGVCAIRAGHGRVQLRGAAASTPNGFAAQPSWRAGSRCLRRRHRTVAAAGGQGDPTGDKTSERDFRRAQTYALQGAGFLLRAFGSLAGIIVFGLFGLVLMESDLRAPLAETLKNADVLVTGVFGLGGWLFVQFLNSVNERFNSVDERFNSVDERFNGIDAVLAELKTLILRQSSSPEEGR